MKHKKIPKKSAKQQEIEVRRMKVETLILAGCKQRDIAEQVGVSAATVNSDLKTLLLGWRQSQLEDIDAALTVELARTETAINAIWPKVIEGNNPSIDRLITLIRCRSRIFGYADCKPTLPVSSQPIQIIEVVKQYG